MSYTTTLIEVDDDGVLLEMADGVMYEGDENDIGVAMSWREGAQIEVTTSSGTEYTHVLHNTVNRQRVPANIAITS
jgi:hypothetical protein